MHCISCGRDEEFDRVVVGRTERPVFGVICGGCERRHLGPLVDGAPVATDGCLLCECDGVYALPEWDAIGVNEDDGHLEFLEYSIETSTPQICEDHYAEIAKDEAAIASDAITSVRASADD